MLFKPAGHIRAALQEIRRRRDEPEPQTPNVPSLSRELIYQQIQHSNQPDFRIALGRIPLHLRNQNTIAIIGEAVGAYATKYECAFESGVFDEIATTAINLEANNQPSGLYIGVVACPELVFKNPNL